MVLAGMSIFIIIELAAVVKMNRLNPLLVVFIWLLAAVLAMDAISIVGSNLGHFEPAKHLQILFSSLLFQVVLVPGLMVGFLNGYRSHSTPAAKMLVILSATIMLTGADYGAEWSGIWKHIRWHWWNDLLMWGVVVLFGLAGEWMYRRFLPIGGDQS